MLLIKKTRSPFVINESFFLDFIKGFSVSKFQSSEPSIVEKHLILFSKSIIKNLGNNCQPCIIRLGTVYGNSMRPRYDLVINLFSGLIANNKKITINGGDQWRPFIHVEDVSRAITTILKSKV